MTQDEANTMVLIFLLGVIWSIVCRAIQQHLSDHGNPDRSSAGPVLHHSQSLAPSRADVGIGPSIGASEDSSDTDRDIDLIRRIDPTFDVGLFLDSGRLVYEAIVMGFAKGDLDLLGNLTSDEVYDEFSQIIAQREQRGEQVELNFVCLKAADVEKVSLFNKQAQITFKFIAQLVTATRDEKGSVVDGDPSKVSEVRDLWTFACDFASETPVWKLIATDAA